MEELDRRTLLAAAMIGPMLAPTAADGASSRKFGLEAASEGVRTFQAVHQGLGSIDVRLFDFGGAPAPAAFLIYDIPVGASEGVHLHNLTDPKLGAFDEYYYILEGRGKMTIDDETILVTAGDHVHAPLDCWRGIENVDDEQRLKIFLTYIDRSSKS